MSSYKYRYSKYNMKIKKMIGAGPNIFFHKFGGIKMESDFPNILYFSPVFPEDLQYLSEGAVNTIHLDPIFNFVIKVPKKLRKQTKLETDFNQKMEMSIDKKSFFFENDIKDYLFENKFDEHIISVIIQDTKKFLFLNKFGNNFKTFLKYKGIISYNNIFYEDSPGVKDSQKIRLVAPAFEYLEIISEDIKKLVIIEQSQALNFYMRTFIPIIHDFKKLNCMGYIHGDLQSNCRNIVVCYDENEYPTLKVIDVDSIKQMYIELTLSDDYGRLNLFKDYLSLIDCSYNISLLDFDEKKLLLENIDYKELFMLLPLESYYIIDTTKKENGIWPEYSIEFDSSEIANGKLTGTFGKPDNRQKFEILYFEKGFQTTISCVACSLLIDINNPKVTERIAKYFANLYDDLLKKVGNKKSR